MANLEGPIRYQYAFDTGQIVDINDLTPSDSSVRKDYECISCGNILRPVLGQDRARHFRHKTQDISCSKETYLHRMGKLIFKSVYEECLQNHRPYTIRLPQKAYCMACTSGRRCERETEWIPFNLVDYFDEIQEEVRDGQFIPDILLTNAKGSKLYVEIAVTHQASDSKVDSGIRIIEFNLEQENDLDLIRLCLLDADSPKVKLLNFKIPEELVQAEHLVSCDRTITFFHVCSRGGAQLREDSFYEFSQLFQASAEYVSEVSGDITNQTFVKEMEQALNAGCLVKDCSLCDHRHRVPLRVARLGREEVFCFLKKESLSSAVALACSDYQSDVANLQPPPPQPKPSPTTEPSSDTAPQEIHRMLVRYVEGGDALDCFLCRNRDISGYKSQPELLVHCRLFKTNQHPDQAQKCPSFDPYSREELKTKVGR